MSRKEAWFRLCEKEDVDELPKGGIRKIADAPPISCRGMIMPDGPNALNEEKFVDRIRCVIDVARNDKDLSVMELIGALEVIKLDLYQELVEMDEDISEE